MQTCTNSKCDQQVDNKLRKHANYSACRRRGGVLKCPRFCFFLTFFFGVESWAAAIDIGDIDCWRIHGQVRATCSKSVVKPHAICYHQASSQMRSLGLLRLDDTCSHQHDDRLAASCCQHSCRKLSLTDFLQFVANRLAAMPMSTDLIQFVANRLAAWPIGTYLLQFVAHRLAAIADVSLLAAMPMWTDLLQFVANFKITLAAILLLASVDMTTSD